MSDETILFAGLMVAVLAVVVGIAYWRLRRLSAQREEAERRAALAFEAMHRATAELRGTPPADAGVAHLPPGERLLRRYSGVTRPTRDGGGGGS